MIEILVNDEAILLPDNCVVSEALTLLGHTAAGFAIALNHNFLPRSLYATTSLTPGDNLMIITPMEGG